MKTYRLPGGVDAEIDDGAVTIVELDGVKIHHLTTIEELLEALDAMSEDGEPLRDWLRQEMKAARDTGSRPGIAPEWEWVDTTGDNYAPVRDENPADLWLPWPDAT